ncbi:MAG: glycosyltransferase family 87 protein [Haloarculaceae archaeon]
MSVASRLCSLRERRPVFVALAVLTLVLLFVYPAIEAWVRAVEPNAQAINFQDLSVYQGAVHRFLNGQSIYVTNSHGGFWGTYLYPPIFILVFWPFTALSHGGAGIAFGVLTTLLLWVALQLAVSQLGVSLRWYERLLGLWALAGYYPVMLSFKLGQTGALTGALVTFALVGLLADDRTGGFASGVATAGVGVLKFAYAPVGAHLLADRDRFLGALAGGVALVAVSVLVFGLDANLHYLDVLAWGVGQGGGDRLPRAYLWFPPYFRQLHWLPGEFYVRLGIAALVAVASLLARDADRAVFSLGVGTFLLITPLPYVYYFVAAIPAVLALLAVEFDRGGYPAIPVLALLFFHVHAYGLNTLVSRLPPLVGGIPDWVYPLLQPGLWATLLLFGLAGYRVADAVVLPDRLAAGVPGRGSPRSRRND